MKSKSKKKQKDNVARNKAMLATTLYFAPAMVCGLILIVLCILKVFTMNDYHWFLSIIFALGGMIGFVSMTLYLIPKRKILVKEERNKLRIISLLFGGLLAFGGLYLIITCILCSPVNFRRILIVIPFISLGVALLIDGINGKTQRMFFK